MSINHSKILSHLQGIEYTQPPNFFQSVKLKKNLHDENKLKPITNTASPNSCFEPYLNERDPLGRLLQSNARVIYIYIYMYRIIKCKN